MSNKKKKKQQQKTSTQDLKQRDLLLDLLKRDLGGNDIKFSACQDIEQDTDRIGYVVFQLLPGISALSIDVYSLQAYDGPVADLALGYIRDVWPLRLYEKPGIHMDVARLDLIEAMAQGERPKLHLMRVPMWGVRDVRVVYPNTDDEVSL